MLSSLSIQRILLFWDVKEEVVDEVVGAAAVEGEAVDEVTGVIEVLGNDVVDEVFWQQLTSPDI